MGFLLNQEDMRICPLARREKRKKKYNFHRKKKRGREASSTIAPTFSKD